MLYRAQQSSNTSTIALDSLPRIQASDHFLNMSSVWKSGVSTRWRMPLSKKDQIVPPTILLEHQVFLLRRLICLLPYDTSYPEYKLYLEEQDQGR